MPSKSTSKTNQKVNPLRDKILATGLDILCLQGLEDLHARTIAQVLKVNHASVHYYFRTRPDLIRAVTVLLLADFKRSTEEVAKAKDADCLRIYLERTEAALDRSGLAIPSLLAATAADAELRELWANHLREQAALVQELVERTRNADVRIRKGPLRDGQNIVALLYGRNLLQSYFAGPRSSLTDSLFN